MRGSFAHLQLRAHLLDLRCLLSELGYESLYLFQLLRDRCFQLLKFVIQHGLALGGRAGCAFTLTQRCGTRVTRVNTIDAKVAECIHSNLTNGDAVPDLGVRGDTTDEGLRDRVEPGEVADADGVDFVYSSRREGPNGIADVNVLEASGLVLS